jgi:hypothetical protein
MANLKLVRQPACFTWHIDPKTSSADLTTESGSFWIQAVIDCALPATKWKVWHAATQILIRAYKIWTANKILPPLHNFVPRNTWSPFAEPRLRNVDLWHILRHPCPSGLLLVLHEYHSVGRIWLCLLITKVTTRHITVQVRVQTITARMWCGISTTISFPCLSHCEFEAMSSGVSVHVCV